MAVGEIRFLYWTRNLTLYNLTKDLQRGLVGGVVVGAFDLLRFKAVMEKLPKEISLQKYFGFESIESQMVLVHPSIKRN